MRKTFLLLILVSFGEAKFLRWLFRLRSGSQANSNNTTTTSNSSTFAWNRFAVLSSLLRKNQEEATLTTYPELGADEVTPQSDLTLPQRQFHIVTTAALPWFTGTAVNPLLRAAYLHRRTKEYNNMLRTNDTKVSSSWVTLVIPWLELEEDQDELYHRVFRNPSEQEEYIREWLRVEASMEDVASELNILFYPARCT